MGLLIDTGVFVHCERSGADFSQFVENRDDETFFLSVITASELLHGVHRARSSAIRARRLAFVEAILSAIPILEIDLEIARSHAAMWADLAARGQMIGMNDSWLAATCLAHGLSVVTANARDFTRVEGLTVEVWSPESGE